MPKLLFSPLIETLQQTPSDKTVKEERNRAENNSSSNGAKPKKVVSINEAKNQQRPISLKVGINCCAFFVSTTVNMHAYEISDEYFLSSPNKR